MTASARQALFGLLALTASVCTGCAAPSTPESKEGSRAYALATADDDGLYEITCAPTGGRLTRRPGTEDSPALFGEAAGQIMTVWGPATTALCCPNGEPLSLLAFQKKREALRRHLVALPSTEGKSLQHNVF